MSLCPTDNVAATSGFIPPFLFPDLLFSQLSNSFLFSVFLSFCLSVAVFLTYCLSPSCISIFLLTVPNFTCRYLPLYICHPSTSIIFTSSLLPTPGILSPPSSPSPSSAYSSYSSSHFFSSSSSSSAYSSYSSSSFFSSSSLSSPSFSPSLFTPSFSHPLATSRRRVSPWIRQAMG